MNAYRSRLLITIAAAALTCLAGCTGSDASATHQPTPQATAPSELFARAMAALRAGGSAHITIVNKSGPNTSVFSQDSGTAGGRQVVTINSNVRTTVILLNGVGYVVGNQAALATFFGFGPSEAGSLAGRWISFQPGDTAGATGYTAVTDGITLGSVSDLLTLTGALTLTGPARIDGRAVIGVRGTPTGSYPAGVQATLYVAADGQPLPVSFQVNSHGYQYTVTFGKWGEALNLSAPAGAIPASSLHPTTA